jgi:hypothetical protein
MRLIPGQSLGHATSVLDEALRLFNNAFGGRDRYLAYINAVHDSYRTLKSVFAQPDLAEGLQTPAYWNLVQLGGPPTEDGEAVDYSRFNIVQLRAAQVPYLALTAELAHQVRTLESAQAELKVLVKLAARPGLPVVYDTNMLNHWQQPGDLPWREVFKAQGEDVPLTRLVVPLTVIDELDRQKYGAKDADLAKRAATAIRYLERTLADSRPGQPVQLRGGVTLEVWVDTDNRGADTDLSILRCAGDLDTLHPGAGTRVLTGDLGMRLRAQQMDLKVMRLPSEYRKPGTAIAEADAQGST